MIRDKILKQLMHFWLFAFLSQPTAKLGGEYRNTESITYVRVPKYVCMCVGRAGFLNI